MQGFGNGLFARANICLYQYRHILARQAGQQLKAHLHGGGFSHQGNRQLSR